jgi:hypothetical protein
MLGWREELWECLAGWTHGSQQAAFSRDHAAGKALASLFSEHVKANLDERRRSPAAGSEDATAGLLRTEVEGTLLDDDQIVSILQGSLSKWDAKILPAPQPLPRYNLVPRRPCPPIRDLGDITRWQAGLVDNDADGLPDDVAWPIVLTAKPSIHTVLAACHLSAGLALQSAGLSLPLVLTAEQVEMDQACLLVGGRSAKDSGQLYLTPQGSAVLSGTGPQTVKAAAALARSRRAMTGIHLNRLGLIS